MSDLFEQPDTYAPLAETLRPRTPDEVVGYLYRPR